MRVNGNANLSMLIEPHGFLGRRLLFPCNLDFAFDLRVAFCTRIRQTCFYARRLPSASSICFCSLSKWRDELSHLRLFLRHRKKKRTPTFRHSISPPDTRKTVTFPPFLQYEMGEQLPPFESQFRSRKNKGNVLWEVMLEVAAFA